jgi:hypothetical protein
MCRGHIEIATTVTVRRRSRRYSPALHGSARASEDEMADWRQIEAVLDDCTEARTCAFCGGGIPRGDESAWGVAARDLRDSVSVMWVHVPCFLAAVRPHLRSGFGAMVGAAPYAERVVGRAAVSERDTSADPGEARELRS